MALWAYVFMPDHVHLLCKPRSYPYDISLFLESVKVSVTRKAEWYRRTSNKPVANWERFMISSRTDRRISESGSEEGVMIGICGAWMRSLRR